MILIKLWDFLYLFTGGVGRRLGGENSHIRGLNFYPIFIPLFGCKVSAQPWPEKFTRRMAVSLTEDETSSGFKVRLMMSP